MAHMLEAPVYRTLPALTRLCSASTVSSTGVSSSKLVDLEEVDVGGFQAVKGSVDGV